MMKMLFKQSLFPRSLGIDPEILLISSVIEVTDHHFFPGLRTPADKLCRIRIELVSLGVIVMGYTLQAATFRSGDRFFKEIRQLPAEVVSRHEQQDLRCTIRIDQPV